MHEEPIERRRKFIATIKVVAPVVSALMAVIAGVQTIGLVNWGSLIRTYSDAPLTTVAPTSPAPSKREPEPPKQIMPKANHATSSRKEPESLVVFIDRFITAAAMCDPGWMLRFYDERVDYFQRGIVSHVDILRDKTEYCARWPLVKSTLIGDVAVANSTDDVRVLVFKTEFHVESPPRNARVSGTAKNVLSVRQVAGTWKIIDEKQQVLTRVR
jgi:hypothetical protein